MPLRIWSQLPFSIRIGPGETVFTRMPWGASACERPFEWTISAPFREGGDGGLGAAHGSHQVDLEVGAPGGVVGAAAAAGVAHQDVEAAELLGGARDEAAQRGGVAHVDR